MTQITISDIKKLPMIDSEVILKCSGSVSIIANGRSVAADPSGTPVRTDQSGLLTLTIPTEDIYSYTLSVQSPGGKGQVFMVDATEKVNQELSKIQTGKDLENATLQDDSKLLDDGLRWMIPPQTVIPRIPALQDHLNLQKSIGYSTSNYSLSVKDAMSNMGTEILLGFIDGVKKLAIGFLKLGKAVISNFQKFINCKVDIPIFSALYKGFISGEEDLTFLYGFSMILAIQVTIIIKMTTGKAPADLTGFGYGSLVKGDTAVDDVQLLGLQQQYDKPRRHPHYWSRRL
ncbi:hypothetical protein BDD12DRAFT_896944 [Trichophaea hybrida]|nr:hypothetical protein BDD12DRAFT_896944 [Trichophaea hybrida]